MNDSYSFKNYVYKYSCSCTIAKRLGDKREDFSCSFDLLYQANDNYIKNKIVEAVPKEYTSISDFDYKFVIATAEE